MSGCISTSTVMEFKMQIAVFFLSFFGGCVLGWYREKLFGEKYGTAIALVVSILWGIGVSIVIKGV